MSTEIKIPKIGFSMTEATLAEWLVEDGATVCEGMPIYSLEMDKSNTEIEAPTAGTIKLIGEVGEVYEIGDVIATIE